MDYERFIASKKVVHDTSGFEIDRESINPKAFEYQKDVISLSCLRGRSAMFVDCGGGKSFMEMEWGRHIWDHSGHDSKVLLMAPLAVGRQFVSEAEKFDIECPVRVVKDQSECGPGINVTNYERLHLFDEKEFIAVIPDESSLLKSFTGKTKQVLCEKFQHTPFRLCGTATPAPNDRKELGNHSQFLGVMDSTEMLMRWFINDTMKAGGYRLAGHAKQDFWRWVASWAVCLRRPSDFGYSDEGFILPEVQFIDYVLPSHRKVKGHLVDPGKKVNATNLHDAKRLQLGEKAEKVAEIISRVDGPAVVWVQTDYEADAIRPLIPDCVEVRGSQSTERKEWGLLEFSEGRTRVIITKPEIGGFGLNWQHAADMTWFPSFSYESFYQCRKRLDRYGQTRTVKVHCVMTDAEESVARTAKDKEAEHLEMQREIVKWLRDSSSPKSLKTYQSSTPSIPNWLTSRA